MVHGTDIAIISPMNRFIKAEIAAVLKTLCRLGAGSEAAIASTFNRGQKSLSSLRLTTHSTGYALYKLHDAGLVEYSSESQLWTVTNENMLEIFE